MKGPPHPDDGFWRGLGLGLLGSVLVWLLLAGFGALIWLAFHL